MTAALAAHGAPVARRLALPDGLWLEVVDSDEAHPREHDGSALPLLLIHGFTGAAATWAALLPSLAARRRVIAVSLPGHGASDAPADPARYAAPRAAADIVSLMDALSLSQVALLGYSMGGRVALHVALLLAATAPERLSALLLESASPGIVDADVRTARRGSDESLADDIERDGVAAFVERWERLPLWESQRALPESARERLRTLRLSNDVRGLSSSLRGLGAGATDPLHHRLHELHELHVPTLLLCGALDAKYVAITHEMAAALPQARASVVPGAGHAVHLERPDDFVREVNDFLGDLAARFLCGKDTAPGI